MNDRTYDVTDFTFPNATKPVSKMHFYFSGKVSVEQKKLTKRDFKERKRADVR